MHTGFCTPLCVSAGDLRAACDNRRSDSDRAADSKQQVTDVFAAQSCNVWPCSTLVDSVTTVQRWLRTLDRHSHLFSNWHDLVCRQPDWLLVDGLKGGSGIALDWRSLEMPVNSAHRGWLLAGGLNAGNVAEAAAIAGPSGVDVSSGVAGPDGVAKDPAQVRAFVAAAKGQRHAPV
jgi:N-(5'phosphoribosyl)anthranilate (PRA) isomerase